MKIRVKERGFFSHKRTEMHTRIDDVMIKEDILKPMNEKTYLFFKGGKHSGVIELSSEETEALANSLKKRTSILKDTRKLSLK